MKAVIMAGGKGSRLRPLTCNKPKPMVPVLNKPVMEYAIELLKKHLITDIAVTLQYLPEVIKNHFGDGSDFGVNLRYFEETIPLGTAGSVKNAEEFLDETFLVISGDGITDYDLTEVVEFHRKQGGIATLVMARVNNPLEYGVIMCDNTGRITRFLEKPCWGEVFSDTVNTGIYVIEPKIFKFFEKDLFFDFSKDLFPLLLSRGIAMFGYVAQGYWSDIGNLEQYRQTQYDLMDGLLHAAISGKEVAEGIWTGQGTILEPGIKLTGRPVYIGDNCKIEEGAEIGSYTILGNNLIIKAGASLKRTVVWDRSFIDNGVELRGVTISNNNRIMAGTAMFEGVVSGDNNYYGKRVIVKPRVKIWPEKVVEDCTILTESLIWSKNRRMSLFLTQGVVGQVNVELFPEMVVRLAVAQGSTIPQGSYVVASSDNNRLSELIKEVFKPGLQSVGINLYDIGVATTPVSRYAVKSLSAKAGVHIRMPGPHESDRIIIEFLDENGINISKEAERKIENTYIHEDFRRVKASGFGEVKYMLHMAEAYGKGLLRNIDRDKVKRCRARLLVAYDYNNLGCFLPALFNQIGCHVLTVNASENSPEDIAAQVTKGHLDIGVLFNCNGDEITLFLPSGEIISDDRMMILWAYICMARCGEEKIGVPVTASSAIEILASEMGKQIIRTKAHPRAIMEISRESLFQPFYDGILIFLRLLEYLIEKDVDLACLLQQLPGTFMHKKDVECPWFQKGTVMRKLLEEVGNRKVELIDGIKIFTEEGWILVLPDCEQPVFRVLSEASTMEAAQRLTDYYTDIIEKYMSV
ncbi:sugar phosphate nucleotidyltransferase [Phosphitispora sp. TUW77]|uniref:sugar phosphate nucleotidyltransferase n=1 Tax=Phosphitispora sp. TUW77 TaxID=3152361 RepID=UPI003AB67B1A